MYDDEGRVREHEQLKVTDEGRGRFRVVHSPCLVEGLAAGDVVVLSDAEPRYIVAERSRNVCVWFVLPRWVTGADVVCSDLADAVSGLGGCLDHRTPQRLVFTVPLVTFGAIQAIFDGATARLSGAQWHYGNVFVPRRPGVPLNWW